MGEEHRQTANFKMTNCMYCATRRDAYLKELRVRVLLHQKYEIISGKFNLRKAFIENQPVPDTKTGTQRLLFAIISFSQPAKVILPLYYT